MTEIGTHLAAHEDRAPSMEASPLMRALDMGVDADTIERLVALQERAEARAARAAFFEALGKFQAECPPVPKTKEATIVTKAGGSYKYKYAPLDAEVAHIRPHLHRNGFAFTWDCESGPTEVKATCHLKHVDGHVESASFSAPTETAAAMSGAQKSGAALTFAQRRSLEQVTGIVTTEDTDAVAPGSGEPITDEQLADLDALITEVGMNRPRFLAWLRVGKLADLPASQYQVAKNALEAKR